MKRICFFLSILIAVMVNTTQLSAETSLQTMPQISKQAPLLKQESSQKQESVSKQSEAPLFINLTSNEAHRSIYALQMALEAMDNGHPVIVFLNVDGVRVGLKSGLQHEPTQYGSATKLLQKVLNKGGQVWVCSSCLVDAGFSQSDLIDGAQIYSSKMLESDFFVDNLKTLSY